MSVSKPACVHNILEGNIQEFVLTEVSRRAVEELFDAVDNMLADAAFNSNVPPLAGCSLIDSRVGLQPLNYSLSRLRATISKFPEARKGSIAVILPAGPLLRTLTLLIHSITPMRLYNPSEREQAIGWLRESVEAASAKH